MKYIEPDSTTMQAFVDGYPVDTPVVMMNLLRFRDQANYEAGAAQPCSGAEAMMRYGAGVNPLIKACGGDILWQGRQEAMLIGPQDKDWHLAVLVRYPSARAFADMVGSQAYQSILFHRTAALEDSRLIAMGEI
jgi:uncharacterized protein (DUF1330 family)